MTNKSESHKDTPEGNETTQDLKERLRLFAEAYADPENHKWSTPIIQNLSVLSSLPLPPHPRATFRLSVLPIHDNGLGNMHGGCTSTVFDICTTFPLQMISRPGFWQYGGVSRTLNVTYLRPVPVGSTVDIECEVVHAGQRLSSLRGVMRSVNADGREGNVLAICEHNKVNTDPPVSKL